LRKIDLDREGLGNFFRRRLAVRKKEDGVGKWAPWQEERGVGEGKVLGRKKRMEEKEKLWAGRKEWRRRKSYGQEEEERECSRRKIFEQEK